MGNRISRRGLRTFLVSGAAGGIGLELTRTLSRSGFRVFAGALNDAEMMRIDAEKLDNVVAVNLDVRNEPSIVGAIKLVSDHLEEGEGLTGIVNNAGVDHNGPLQCLTVAEIRQMIEVNLLGAVLLTRAALPLLRSQGRIVFTSSATGLLAPPTVSVYAATKFAVEGLADALRLELRPLGIHVAVVEPGVVRTPMALSAPEMLERMWARMSDAERTTYGRSMRKIVDMSSGPDVGIRPQEVAEAIQHALTSRRPRRRYPVGRDAQAAAWLRHLPDAVRDRMQRRLLGL